MKKKIYSVVLLLSILMNLSVPSIYAEEYREDNIYEVKTDQDEEVEDLVLDEDDSPFDDRDEKEDIQEEELEPNIDEDKVILDDEDNIDNSLDLSESNKESSIFLIDSEYNKDGEKLNIIVGLKDGVDIDELVFPEVDEKGRPIEGVGYYALSNKNISGDLVFPESYKLIDIGAFDNNKISSIEGKGITRIEESAFIDNKITNLNLEKVENIGPWAFKSNEIEKLSLANVKELGEGAFEKNEIREIEMPNLKIVGDWAFEGNQLDELYLPQVKEVGEKAFANNMLETISLPQVETIKEKAFGYDDFLEEINKINSFKTDRKFDKGTIDTTIFGNNISSYGHMVPVFIEDKTIENLIDEDYGVIYNPSDIFVNNEYAYLIGRDIENAQETKTDIRFKGKIQVDKGKINIKFNEQSAEVIDEEQFYCIDVTSPMISGLYKLRPLSNQDYIYVHMYDDENAKTEGKDRQVHYYQYSEEIEYNYSYRVSLINKLVDELKIRGLDKKGLDIGYWLYPITSNIDIKDKVSLNEENFIDIIKNTDRYSDLIELLKEYDVFDEQVEKEVSSVYQAVADNKKDYSEVVIGEWLEKDWNTYGNSEENQIVIRPGKPETEEPETPETEEPETPETEEPVTPETEEPVTPETEEPETPETEEPETPETEEPVTPETEEPEIPGIEKPETPDNKKDEEGVLGISTERDEPSIIVENINNKVDEVNTLAPQTGDGGILNLVYLSLISLGIIISLSIRKKSVE